MGLTIHYQLQTPLTEPRAVRTLVAAMRATACTLPFAEVDDVVEFCGSDTKYEQGARDDEHHWLKIQAGRYVRKGDSHHHVLPDHIVAFSTYPGEGCEPANFGFCQYPRHITITDPKGGTRRLTTGLRGWSWSSFCKTQYASYVELKIMQTYRAFSC
jgi:hypothetical protein